MRVLVTGATGLVGNNVVRMLLDRGDQVWALARGTSDPRPLAGLNVQIVGGDLRDAQTLLKAAAQVDLVVHSAAQVHIGWTGLEQARAVNVEGTRNVALAALAAKVRMVHVSSVDALGMLPGKAVMDEDTPPGGNVPCPYVITKRAAEEMLLEMVDQGLDAVIVNPVFMIGPWDWRPSSGRMLLQVARGWCLFAPLGGNTFCDVRDAARGILLAAERGKAGRRYILGGEALSYFQAWRVFAKVTGGTPPRFPAGPLARIGAGIYGDMVTRLTGHELDVNSAATTMSAQGRHYSCHRAVAELGYTFRPLADAAADAWRWFEEYGYVRRRTVAI